MRYPAIYDLAPHQNKWHEHEKAGISLDEGEAEVDAFIVEWLERQSKDT